MNPRAFMLMFLGSIFAILPGRMEAQEGKVYTLAVVPLSQAISTGVKWAPFVTKLSQEAGVTIRIKKYYSSIQQFESDLKKGVPDFAYVNSFHMVVAHKTQKYIPLIRDRDPLFGILVAHKNADVHSLQDLKGRVIAFPSQNSFGSSLYMRWLLIRKEQISFKSSYVQRHDNVYQHVLLGRAAAGGGIQKTFDSQPEEIKNQLRIIYLTPPLISHPFAAHPRVPELVRTKVINAFLKLGNDPANKQLLNSIQLGNPVVADYGTDYAPLTTLGLEKFAGAE